MDTITADQRQELVDTGYTVKAREISTWQTDYWAITPEGNSIFRGPASTEEDAWRGCWNHYQWRQQK